MLVIASTLRKRQREELLRSDNIEVIELPIYDSYIRYNVPFFLL